LAERPINPALDSAAFEYMMTTSGARVTNGEFRVFARDLDGQQHSFLAQRIIGVDPLRQVLIAKAGGRMQVDERAFDSRHFDWFDIYGDENRQLGEWGHWTGRGMNWNAMCAACHNTRLRKHHDEITDSYATTMAEMGVGCEACHGPMADHNAWQAKHPKQKHDPTVRRLDRDQILSTCGSCHSRRAELTGEFVPGQSFFDHYALTIPDDTDLFYPDGQVRDEDYEFTAFLGSRMRAAGVRCIDCHEPHSSKTRLPGDSLCLTCHGAPVPPAPRIDPATHSHHSNLTILQHFTTPFAHSPSCTDCHMPITTYMQRHPRHDHGFTIPDPLLTKQLAIPNACNRCHTNQTADWSLAAVEKWHGSRMDRPTRARAHVVARARSGQTNSAPELVALLNGETNSLWRAVAANLLRHWANDPKATAALLSSAGDPDPLVRAMSVRALEPLAQSGGQAVQMALRSRLDDPARCVRIDAAWALHASLDTNSVAGRDLLHYFQHAGDEPSGALQRGVFWMDRGDLSRALTYFQRAVNWDTNSAPSHNALAVALSMEGKSDEAVRELEAACRLAPRDAEYRFKLGLALNEIDKLDAARASLEEAVKLEPQFTQAWYNLGLACNATGDTDQALASLARAESLDRSSAQIPYARATILARVGRVEEARAAARRALQIQPGYVEAQELLRTLGQ
jgi:predicted CXXCH cytochrome family protein